MFPLKTALRALAAMAALGFTLVAACPFCLSPPQTFSAQFLLSDFVVIAELRSFQVLQQGTLPVATFRVQRLLSGDPQLASACGIRVGQQITRNAEAGGQPGDLYLLFGDVLDSADTADLGALNRPTATFSAGSPSGEAEKTQPAVAGTPGPVRSVSLAKKSRVVDWSDHTGISAATADYLTMLPSQTLPVPERLAWYVTHLESADPMIAGDAWAEFGMASYADVKACRHLYSAVRLRGWIADPGISPERLGLYGLMLGLCGESGDAVFLRRQLMAGEAGEFRFGAEGLLAGYLLLTGETGLASVERQFLQPATLPTARHALLQTLDFFHTYEPGLISRERICGSARQLLRDPVLAEMTVMSLSRWQDWESMAVLERLFDATQRGSAGEADSLHRCIVQFAQHCSRAGHMAVGPDVPVVDPATVRSSGVADQFLKRVAADHGHLLRVPKSEFQAPSP
ncbi:MAG: hypothetical protein ACKO2P_10880 [Planctomycetota bacterium]